MTALQMIGMGLVITLVDSDVAGFDAVPDVVGWVLVVLGLRDLRGRVRTDLVPVAVLAGGVSLLLVHSSFVDGQPESTGWLLSLPQIAFSFLLCRALAVLARSGPGDRGVPHGDGPFARRFRWLSWAFLVAAAGPVLLYGGGIERLLTPLAVLTVVSNVLLVYLVFRASGTVHSRRFRCHE